MTMALRVIFLLGSILLWPLSAWAQQAQQTPLEQAIGTKLIQELQYGLACQAEMIALKTELVKAQARIKELEDKANEHK